MKNIVLSLFLPLCLIACNVSKKKIELNVGVNNYSYNLDKVDMKVYLNEVKIIDDTVAHSAHEKLFRFKYGIGHYDLKIVTLDGKVTDNQKFTISKNDTLLGISIRFDYKIPDDYDSTSRKRKILTRFTRNGKVIKDW